MKLLITAVIFLSAFVLLSLPARAVDVIDPICEGTAASSAACKDNQAQQGRGDRVIFGANGIVTKLVNVFSLIIGAAAVIVIMISGVRIVTSNGDPNTISTSRNWILYSVVGLVVAATAQAIVQLVLKQIGG